MSGLFMFDSLKAEYDVLVNVRLAERNHVRISGIDQVDVYQALLGFANFVERHPGWVLDSNTVLARGVVSHLDVYVNDGSGLLDVGDAIASEFEQAGLKVRRLLTQQYSEKIVPTFAEA